MTWLGQWNLINQAELLKKRGMSAVAYIGTTSKIQKTTITPAIAKALYAFESPPPLITSTVKISKAENAAKAFLCLMKNTFICSRHSVVQQNIYLSHQRNQ